MNLILFNENGYHVHSSTFLILQLYLEPIFSRGSLPQEEARFKKINAHFIQIVSDLARNPRVDVL